MASPPALGTRPTFLKTEANRVEKNSSTSPPNFSPSQDQSKLRSSCPSLSLSVSKFQTLLSLGRPDPTKEGQTITSIASNLLSHTSSTLSKTTGMFNLTSSHNTEKPRLTIQITLTYTQLTAAILLNSSTSTSEKQTNTTHYTCYLFLFLFFNYETTPLPMRRNEALCKP